MRRFDLQGTKKVYGLTGKYCHAGELTPLLAVVEDLRKLMRNNPESMSVTIDLRTLAENHPHVFRTVTHEDHLT